MNSKQQTEYDEAVKRIQLERETYGMSSSGDRVPRTNPNCMLENNGIEALTHEEIDHFIKNPLPPPPQFVENKTEYCEECEEDHPADTFKESNKWCSNVCESCWLKEQPPHKPKMEEFYIETKKYDQREKARRIERKQERHNMLSSGATEKELRKFDNRFRANKNARFERFWNKWEAEIFVDKEIKRNERLRKEADKQFMEENS